MPCRAFHPVARKLRQANFSLSALRLLPSSCSPPAVFLRSRRKSQQLRDKPAECKIAALDGITEEWVCSKLIPGPEQEAG